MNISRVDVDEIVAEERHPTGEAARFRDVPRRRRRAGRAGLHRAPEMARRHLANLANVIWLADSGRRGRFLQNFHRSASHLARSLGSLVVSEGGLQGFGMHEERAAYSFKRFLIGLGLCSLT